jgi:hypothetical protein
MKTKSILVMMRLGVGAGVDGGEEWNNTARETPGLYAVGLGLTTLDILQLAVRAGLDRYERCHLRK